MTHKLSSALILMLDPLPTPVHTQPRSRIHSLRRHLLVSSVPVSFPLRVSNKINYRVFYFMKVSRRNDEWLVISKDQRHNTVRDVRARRCAGAYMQPHVRAHTKRAHTQSLGPLISGFIFDINLQGGWRRRGEAGHNVITSGGSGGGEGGWL